MTTNAQKKKINVVIYHSQQYARPSELAHAPAVTVIMNGWIIVRKALPIRVPVATRCLINTSRRAGCELELYWDNGDEVCVYEQYTSIVW
jgi:hypothetical protein